MTSRSWPWSLDCKAESVFANPSPVGTLSPILSKKDSLDPDIKLGDDRKMTVNDEREFSPMIRRVFFTDFIEWSEDIQT